MKLVSITRTANERKEFKAIFNKNGKEYVRRFGTASNYVLNSNKTDADRDAYRKRHRAMKAEAKALNDPMSPASLSMYVLWGDSRSLSKNITAFKRRFNL